MYVKGNHRVPKKKINLIPRLILRPRDVQNWILILIPGTLVPRFRTDSDSIANPWLMGQIGLKFIKDLAVGLLKGLVSPGPPAFFSKL